MLWLRIIFWLAVALVFHVYVLYPLGIWLRSRFATEPDVAPPADHELPSVTVLIPAHNEEKWIARKLGNTLELDYPRDRFQVLLASDGCDDATVAIAQKYADVEINHSPQRTGKTATLNRVVPGARGEIVLLTDANALLAPGTLRALVRHFHDPDVGCVSGQKSCLQTASRSSEGEGLYWRYESAIKQAESKLGSCLGGTGQVMAFRKSLYPGVPVIGDDFYIPMKIMITGALVRFEAEALAFIPAAANLRLELERKVRSHVSLFRDLPYLKTGLNPLTSRIWWRFLSHHVLRLLVPPALILIFLLSFTLWPVSLTYRTLAIGQCIFYLAAFTGYLLTNKGRRSLFYVPFYFVFANLGVLLAWFRWMRGKHQYAWQRTDRILPAVESTGRVRT